MGRIICHFSCGAASAVATKLTLAECDPARAVILNAFVAEEHSDNRRFLVDCERWFNHPVTVVQDEKYGASVRELWRRKRFLNSRLYGPPCSAVLKHALLDAFCRPNDAHVLGYTAEETERFERFTAKRPTLSVRAPLIERNLTKADCLAIVERAGIELPAMYRLGFNNANCVGCCRGGRGLLEPRSAGFPGSV